MKIIFTIVLGLAIAGAAFAQGTPERAKEIFHAKQRVQQGKQMHRGNYHILRAKSAHRQKPRSLGAKAQRAKKIEMMMRAHMQRLRQGSRLERRRHITDRGLHRAGYAKYEARCRTAQDYPYAHLQPGDNRGKQAVAGKQRLQQCPLRDKLQANCPQCQ